MPRLPFGLVVVRGRSMRPTFRDGDVLLVARAGFAPRVGRAAVLRLPGSRPDAVKRLVARETDGGWWVERDNPEEGADSWVFGAVPSADLIGVVVARVWPRPGRVAPAPHPPGGADAGREGQG